MARFSLRRPPAGQDPDGDDFGPEEMTVDEPAPAASGRRRASAAPWVDDGLKPSAMRRPEPLYGYVVALELLVVSVLNLTVTKGKGAPAHPNTGLAVAGVAASVALAAIIFKVRHRTFVGFAAIAAAFVVNLSRGPSSLAVAHIFALVFPFAYAFIITQRQRKQMTAELKAARANAEPRAGGGRAGGRSPAPTARRKGTAAPAAKGPRPNARYTPPKPKRPKPGQKPAGR